MKYLIAALMIAAAVPALAATGDGTEQQPQIVADPITKLIVDRVKAGLPKTVKLASIKRLENRVEKIRLYVVTFDLSKVPGVTNRIVSSGVQMRETDGIEHLYSGIDDIVSDMNRIVGNLAKGDEWNLNVKKGEALQP